MVQSSEMLCECALLCVVCAAAGSSLVSEGRFYSPSPPMSSTTTTPCMNVHRKNSSKGTHTLTLVVGKFLFFTHIYCLSPNAAKATIILAVE